MTILTDLDIYNLDTNLNLDYVINDLEKKRLIPLTFDHPKINIMARIIGHLFGDGYLGTPRENKRSTGNEYLKTTVGFTGNKEDLLEIKKDLEILGFQSQRIKQEKAVSYVKLYRGGKLIKHRINGVTTYMRCESVSLWVLFKLLGVPVGRKSKICYSIPHWIVNSPKPIKKEFLSGFAGSEINVPVLLSNGMIRADFAQSKSIHLVDNLKDFMNELVLLFKEFGVNFVVRPLKQEAENSITARAYFSGDNNCMNFCRNIGFTYSNYRKMKMFFTLRFIVYKQNEIRKRRDKVKQVRFYKNQGYSKNQIEAILGKFPVSWFTDMGYNFQTAKGLNILSFKELLEMQEK